MDDLMDQKLAALKDLPLSTTLKAYRIYNKLKPFITGQKKDMNELTILISKILDSFGLTDTHIITEILEVVQCNPSISQEDLFEKISSIFETHDVSNDMIELFLVIMMEEDPINLL